MTAGFKKFRSRASRINGAKKNGKIASDRSVARRMASQNRKEWKQMDWTSFGEIRRDKS